MNSKLILLGCAAVWLSAGQDIGTTRQIVPEEFLRARPVAKPKTPARKTAERPKPIASPEASHSLAVGLTVWRLRPATASDTGARLLVQNATENEEWVPERVAAGTSLRLGNRVRLGFESAREGYLYVIDREEYADGTFGQPYVIFPTARTRNGDNHVLAGRLIEIPGREDRPNYLTVRQSRPDQIGEVLSVIVASRPLQEIRLEAQAHALPPAVVAQWEKQWTSFAQPFEPQAAASRPWTKPEQEAGASATRLLTQDEPVPQTIYRLSNHGKGVYLFQVKLPYAP